MTAAALAAAPVLALLLLIVGLRWTAAAAGVAAAALTAAIALLAFDFGSAGALPALAGTAAEAAFSAATILWIIFAALAIHEYQTRSGAIDVFRTWLCSFGDDRGTSILLIAWFFALFLEGAAGFGTPVALAAPLLVGLGVPPVRALTAVLVGHAAGVSFGAVGTPVVPLAAVTGLDPHALAVGIAAVHAALGWTLAASALRIAEGKIAGAGATLALAVFCFLVPFFWIAWAVGPELPTLAGAAVGAAAFLAYVRLRGGRGKGSGGRSALAVATAPYLAVILLVLATRLVPPVRDVLAGVTLSWQLDGGFEGSVAPLFHPGTLLLAALLAAAAPRPAGRELLLPSLGGAAARLPKVAVALFAVLLVARLMVHSGMVELLARSAAQLVGAGWPAAAPTLGALGSFITGSATASNILFGEMQRLAAVQSGTSPMLAAIGQGAGAAVGNMIAPHNIVAGAATVGLVGAEAAVLRRTLPICLGYALAAGLLLWVSS